VKLTIVVPIFNETQSLPVFLNLVEEAKSNEVFFLLVDNGSTKEEVRSILSKKSQFWSSIRTEKNLGFGGGILFGIRRSGTEFVGWMPGNLKVDPREVAQVLTNQELKRTSFVKAERSGRIMSARAKTAFVGLIQSILLKSNMLDSGGTPTVCHKDFILKLNNPPDDYTFESYVLYSARKAGLKVSRPKITYGQRLFGESHWQRGFRSEVALMKKIWVASKSWRAT